MRPAAGGPAGATAGGAGVVSPGQPAAEATAAGGVRHPRVTGRMVVLVLVLAVLAVSYASSMRAFLQQRAHIVDLKAEIAQRESSIAELSRERDRWDDPAYAEEQARARFGYVMPGDTSYVVLDEDGEPLQPEATLDDADVPEPEDADLAWWDRGWASVEVAGDPPRPEAPPATRIDGPTPGRTG